MLVKLRKTAVMAEDEVLEIRRRKRGELDEVTESMTVPFTDIPEKSI